MTRQSMTSVAGKLPSGVTAEDLGAGMESDEIGQKLVFLKKLQAVTNAIHSTPDIDDIIEHVSHDICDLFEADRLTVYRVSDDGENLISKVKTGLQSHKDIRLPINNASIAGYAAFNRKSINVTDCYDDAELKRHAPPLVFHKEVDRRTGYRTRQGLALPMFASEGRGELLGVLQLINSRDGERFATLVEEGAVEVAKTLGIAFSVRKAGGHAITTKFDYLVTEGIISAGELDLATRTARRKGKNVEEVLADEFNVTADKLGGALAHFYAVPYEPYRADRIRSIELFRNLKREYVENNQWLPLEDTTRGLVILATDPERLRSLRIVANGLPGHPLR